MYVVLVVEVRLLAFGLNIPEIARFTTPVTPLVVNLPPFLALLTALDTCPKVFFAFDSVPLGPPLVDFFTAAIALDIAELYVERLRFLNALPAAGTSSSKKRINSATLTFCSWYYLACDKAYGSGFQFTESHLKRSEFLVIG